MKIQPAITAIAVLLILSIGGPAFAHHSIAHYDPTQVLELKGTVTGVRWRQPHVYVVYDVKASDGTTVEWTGELASPTSLMAQGVTRDSIKVGDEIVVTTSPAKNGNHLGFVRKIVGADGKVRVGQQALAP